MAMVGVAKGSLQAQSQLLCTAFSNNYASCRHMPTQCSQLLTNKHCKITVHNLTSERESSLEKKCQAFTSKMESTSILNATVIK